MNLSRHFLPLTLLAGLGLTGPARAATTFTRDVAAIVFQHCAPCHRPGQGGPFPLLTFADCRKHATDLADVTGRRYMPPWLPTGPVNEFVGDRRLTDAEIAVFKAWLADGSPEGEAKDLPPLPAWPGEWQLGTPDVVAQMPAAYTLQPGGRDVYRHFALPLTQPLDRPRWIRAFEFHPGSRQVHHAFLYVARNNDVQRLDAADPVVGFGGMDTPTEVHSPGGYFLSWQPGKRTLPLPAGMGWKLEPGTALVMQMHLQPGGKPEPIQAGVGLWFADSPATNQPLKLGLNIYDLDLAPGQSNLVYTREFVLPGDTDLLGVLPHTHYLGRRIEAWAELPDQTRRDLLTIPDWDFNWQVRLRQHDGQSAQPLQPAAPRGFRHEHQRRDGRALVPAPAPHRPRPLRHGPRPRGADRAGYHRLQRGAAEGEPDQCHRARQSRPREPRPRRPGRLLSGAHQRGGPGSGQ